MSQETNSLNTTAGSALPFVEQHPVYTAVLIYFVYLIIATLLGLAAPGKRGSYTANRR